MQCSYSHVAFATRNWYRRAKITSYKKRTNEQTVSFHGRIIPLNFASFIRTGAYLSIYIFLLKTRVLAT